MNGDIVSRKLTAAPVAAPSAALTMNDSMYIAVTLMPTRRAASARWATAWIARPSSLRRSQTSSPTVNVIDTPNAISRP